uniref:Uncharacterized protein n=1 Tax=Anolis carolinensis TaxID=28377 RepID=L7N028_ANOCA
MSPKRSATASEKIELLNMLQKGRLYAAVGCHYGINESTVHYIKKEEKNIRSTATVTFNKTAKRVITLHNKSIVKMESALAFLMLIGCCYQLEVRWRHADQLECLCRFGLSANQEQGGGPSRK